MQVTAISCASRQGVIRNLRKVKPPVRDTLTTTFKRLVRRGVHIREVKNADFGRGWEVSRDIRLREVKYAVLVWG